MDKIFKSLADVNRRKILTILNNQSLSVNQILTYLDIRQATLSSHLAILRKAGLVSFRIQGKERIYKLNGEVMVKFVESLNKFVKSKVVSTSNEIIVRRKVS